MRLTKDVKAKILSAALNKSGVFGQEAAIRKRYADWIEYIRVQFITPEVEKAIESAKKCLEPYQEVLNTYVSDITNVYLLVNVAGQQRKIYFKGTLNNEENIRNISKRIPSRCPTLTADDQLVQKLYDIDADSAEVDKLRESVTAAVNAYLNAATTVKALLKLWPECEPLIPTEVAPSGVNLPSVLVSDLNKLLKLS